MPLFGGDHDFAQAHETVNGTPHKAALSHELIAAAAAYEASKKYEEHRAKNGQIDDHAKAKEFLAAASGAFIDHFVETKGLDFIDRQKAKREAEKHAHQALADSGDY